jgi:DNA invertase Pin-like site-specific DNA recombinase
MGIPYRYVARSGETAWHRVDIWFTLHVMRKVIKPIATHPPKGQTVGYVRVSTFEQNESRQLEGLELDRVFTDKASGKDIKRPQLEALLTFVREGDTVICHSMDRLGRNLVDLRRTVTDLTARKIGVRFVKENLVLTGDDSPMATLLLNMMGSFAEFELAWSRERQREGIEVAKRAGVYKGRKRLLTPEKAAELDRRLELGESKAALAREFGLDRTTVYRYIGRAAAKPATRVRAGK